MSLDKLNIEGRPSESNCYADIDCVFQYLVKEKKIPPEHIVLHGRSLGSGPSCYLAAKTTAEGRSVAGLILHAPFTSVYRVVMPDFFGYTLCGDKFPNIDRMRNIDCPVLIAHGTLDKIVPFSHGKALQKASPKAEMFTTYGMHHNYIETVQDEDSFIEAVNDFLDFNVLARRLWMHPLVNSYKTL